MQPYSGKAFKTQAVSCAFSYLAFPRYSKKKKETKPDIRYVISRYTYREACDTGPAEQPPHSKHTVQSNSLLAAWLKSYLVIIPSCPGGLYMAEVHCRNHPWCSDILNTFISACQSQEEKVQFIQSTAVVSHLDITVQ